MGARRGWIRPAVPQSARPTFRRMSDPVLRDTFGRPLGSLRISVTDRCNMRCRYCMPEDEYVWLPRESILTFEEIARLVGVFGGLGVHKIRLTGGEPLLRHDLPTLVDLIARDARITDLAMTTNGLLLAKHAAALHRAGLKRLTVSLDTLRAARMLTFAKSERHGDVLAGIAAARAAGYDRLKLNSVVIRGFNDDELADLLEFGRANRAEVRFIEYMDVGGATRWSMDQVVSQREMLERLTGRYGRIEPIEGDQGSPAPAERFRLADGTTFGIIASTTQRRAEKELARRVVLVDVIEGVPQGKALDQWESASIEGFDTRVIGANDYAPAAGSELVVVTAGIARKPGMSRDDLVRTNADIVRHVSLQIKQHCPKAIVLVVSNPLDVMCWVAKQVTGFPRERVIGMAGVLDTARFRAFLAEALDASVEDIQAMVLGGHGDTMVPLISYTTVAGIPVTHFLSKSTLDKIVERTRNGGAVIVAFLKTGSAYYAPSAAVVQMVEAIVHDKKRVLPCAAWLQGEYGLSGMYCGVPCKLGRNGLEKILEVKLSPDEQAALKKSAEAVKETMAAVSLRLPSSSPDSAGR